MGRSDDTWFRLKIKEDVQEVPIEDLLNFGFNLFASPDFWVKTYPKVDAWLTFGQYKLDGAYKASIVPYPKIEQEQRERMINEYSIFLSQYFQIEAVETRHHR